MLSDKTISMLEGLLYNNKENFKDLPKFEKNEEIESVMNTLINKLRDNDPYFHPHYVGHMSSYASDFSLVGHLLASQINPNNHSYDGGRATTNMEIECIESMGSMIGWKKSKGHLTSSGTIANLEALWVARESGAQTLLFSDQAHYSHKRNASILGMKHRVIPTDNNGRMLIDKLEYELLIENNAVVIATIGTTLLGSVDPIDKIIEFKNKYNFILHIDAAYGGYFKLIENKLNKNTKKAFSCFHCADSIVIDPHKKGLQPFGCGSILINPDFHNITKKYEHDSPYTYFDKNGVSLGKETLECSRSGAAAAALWATMQYYPLDIQGEFSLNLAKSREAAEILIEMINTDDNFECICEEYDLDIVVFKIKNETDIKIRTQKVFSKMKDKGYFLALASGHYRGTYYEDTLIRCTLMKCEHLSIIKSLYETLVDTLSECTVLPPSPKA